MNKFVLISFAVLGWIFWELSGGSDFEPKSVTAQKDETSPEVAPPPVLAQKSALSVPIVKATVQITDQQPAPLAPPSAPIVAQNGAEVLVASLASGAEAFATPGAPLFNLNRTDVNAQSGELAISVSAEATPDVREVRGSRVNMRGGPGTSYGVITVLSRGQEVEVLRENGGWVKLRDSATGAIGWMSAKMLTPKQVN